MEDKVKDFDSINSAESMSSFIEGLRVFASNNRNDKNVLDIIERTLQRCNELHDEKSMVKLYEIKISQIELIKERHQEIVQLIQKMIEISDRIEYKGGLALSYYKRWYIEKVKGNEKFSQEALDKSMHYVFNYLKSGEYEYHVCNYSFAFEKWLKYRDVSSIDIFEECAEYFFRNGFYLSYSKCISVLLIIYQQTQNKKQSTEITKKFLRKNELLDNVPDEIKAIVYFYIGINQELSNNLAKAEEYLLNAKKILKPIYRTSIYSSYYPLALSYLTATYSLRGKLELAWNQMKEAEDLIEEATTIRSLDNFNKQQLKHIFNLTKFYIFSRLQNVEVEDLQELVQEILLKIGKYYSNTIFFTEFLLNANLSKKQLIKIKKLNTPSTRRVGHILDFLIAKKNYNKENQILELVSTLQRRPAEERMTLEERVIADLLAAQEYFKLKRYTEIYPLLRKYEKRLDQIEVLELRLFMEAFIQIGAYNNGDLMGPVNQYLAIKKCRLYRFTKLENRLLDYLDIQAKEARTNTNYIYS